jgi:hypothetical protein
MAALAKTIKAALSEEDIRCGLLFLIMDMAASHSTAAATRASPPRLSRLKLPKPKLPKPRLPKPRLPKPRLPKPRLPKPRLDVARPSPLVVPTAGTVSPGRILIIMRPDTAKPSPRATGSLKRSRKKRADAAAMARGPRAVMTPAWRELVRRRPENRKMRKRTMPLRAWSATDRVPPFPKALSSARLIQMTGHRQTMAPARERKAAVKGGKADESSFPAGTLDPAMMKAEMI